MTILTKIIKYSMADTAGVVGQNPYKEKARFDSIQNWKYVDKLNKLQTFKYSVPNDDFHVANAVVERKIFIPFISPFRGLITERSSNDSSITMLAKEFATHLERRIFTNDGEKKITYTDEKWFNTSWKHRQKFIFNKDHVFRDTVNIPININLGVNTSFKNNALPNGDDFVVTQIDGVTVIPHEIEDYDSATGTLVLWLKLPKISDSANVEVYVYYNNSGATNQEDIVNVWKDVYGITQNDGTIPFSYAMVQHLDKNDGQIYTESTTANSLNIHSGAPDGTRVGIEIDVGSVHIDKNMTTVLMILRKTGTPTGNATIGIMDAAENVITSKTLDVSTLGTGDTNVTTQLNVRKMVATDRFFIEYTVGDGSNHVNVRGLNGTMPAGLSTFHKDPWVSIGFRPAWTLTGNIIDSTENDNNGVPTNITHVVGKIGNSSQFNLVDSIIDCGSDTTVDNVWTGNGWVTAIINPNSDGENNSGSIFRKGSGVSAWALRLKDEVAGFVAVELAHTTDGVTGLWRSPRTIPLGSFTRIDVVFNKDSISNNPIMYINGVSVLVTENSTPTGTIFDDDSAEKLIIGNEIGQGETFDGEIDEIRMMKLPPENISNLILTEFHFQQHPVTHISRLPHEELKKAANLIAQDILDSANTDQPSGVTWTLDQDFPTTEIQVLFKFKNHYECLNEIALILGKDLFFDNDQHIVFVSTKGKTLDGILDVVITSNPKVTTEDFANEINMLGSSDDVGIQKEVNVTDLTVLRFNYEKVVADDKLETTDHLTNIGNEMLSEFKKLTPQIKGQIPIHQFNRLNLKSGDIVKIVQPRKQLNGLFRVMDIKADAKKAKLSLESTETGVFRVRSNSFTDIIEGMLKRINDSSIL